MPSDARTQQTPDKEALRTDLLKGIREDLETLTRTQKDASEGATHSENRAEHAKDTRATEQGYLARGLAERVEELHLAEARLVQLPLRTFEPSDTIEITAVVHIQEKSNPVDQLWWILPMAGGMQVTNANFVVRTITPSSPMGRALMGLHTDDDGVFRTPRGERAFRVIALY